MKTIKYTAIALFAGIIMLTSCTKHDFVYDNVITGSVGPQASWTIGSSAVRAGERMDFRAQYYTTVPGVTISRVEVWYDVIQVENTSVVSRHSTATGGFTRFNNITTVTPMRISQLIHTIPHDLSNPNIFLHDRATGVFVMEETFPVSPTIPSFDWEPDTFNAVDSLEMKRLFGDDFMERFKQEMRNAMRFPDFERMFVGTAASPPISREYELIPGDEGDVRRPIPLISREEFNQYRDSVQRTPEYLVDAQGNLILDANGNAQLDWSNRDNIIFIFTGNELDENRVVITPINLPERIEELFNTVTFAELVAPARDGENYNVSYQRFFQINAHLRIFDSRGVFSSTRIWQIDVQ